MKIAYLTTIPLPSRRAGSGQVLAMCEALARTGNEVTLYAPREGWGAPDPGSIFKHYGVRTPFDIRTYWVTGLKAGRHRIGHYYPGWHAKRNGAELIYARCHAKFPCHAALRTGIPLLLEFHAFYESNRTIGELLGSPQLQRVVFNCEALRDLYEDDPRFPRDIGMVLHNAAAEPTTAKPHSLADPEKFHVGYLGHLYKGKGMETIAALAPLCPWAKFHVVGGREEDIARWRAKLTGVTNIEMHGYLPPAELDRYRRAFDVLLAPYGRVIEGIGGHHWNLANAMSPLKVFEAMASGKPLIASAIPVVEAVVSDGETAVLCDPDDTAAWQRALEYLRDNPVEASAIATRAEAEFRRHYTWDARARAAVAGLGGVSASG